MFREMLKSKIHRATVTDANLNYIGSITIDPILMEASDIREYEKVAVVNINNGARLETYAIKGKPGTGEVCMNGAAARLAHTGDKVIIMAYAWLTEDSVLKHAPRVVHVDERNAISS